MCVYWRSGRKEAIEWFSPANSHKKRTRTKSY